MEDERRQRDGTRERKCESDISFTNVSSEITFIINRILVEIYTSKKTSFSSTKGNKTERRKTKKTNTYGFINHKFR